MGDSAEMHVGARGYVGLNPIGGGRTNVALVLPAVRAASARGRLEPFFLETLREFPGVYQRVSSGRLVRKVLATGPFAVWSSRVVTDGAALVGDAADFFDPFTGEGVYKALRGAELAAQVASAALERDDLSARSLARYSALRRREFTAKDLVCRMVQLFVTFPSATDYVVPRIARRPRVRSIMTGVLGDFADARAALSPLYLWSLLRP
jgi:flavin-dependent dehydrogenase